MRFNSNLKNVAFCLSVNLTSTLKIFRPGNLVCLKKESMLKI